MKKDHEMWPMPQILPRYLSFLIRATTQVFNHIAATQYVVLCRTMEEVKVG